MVSLMSIVTCFNSPVVSSSPDVAWLYNLYSRKSSAVDLFHLIVAMLVILSKIIVSIKIGLGKTND